MISLVKFILPQKYTDNCAQKATLYLLIYENLAVILLIQMTFYSSNNPLFYTRSFETIVVLNIVLYLYFTTIFENMIFADGLILPLA